MTARANSLTERVTNRAGSAGIGVDRAGKRVSRLVNALGRLGYNVDTLLATADS